MRFYRVNWIYLTNNNQVIIFRVSYFREFLSWNFWRTFFVCRRYDDGCILIISVIEQNWLIKARTKKNTHVLFQFPSVSVFFLPPNLGHWFCGIMVAFSSYQNALWLDSNRNVTTTSTTLTIPEKKLCPWSDLLTFHCLWSGNCTWVENCSIDELRSHGNCDRPNSQALCVWEREGALWSSVGDKEPWGHLHADSNLWKHFSA